MLRIPILIPVHACVPSNKSLARLRIIPAAMHFQLVLLPHQVLRLKLRPQTRFLLPVPPPGSALAELPVRQFPAVRLSQVYVLPVSLPDCFPPEFLQTGPVSLPVLPVLPEQWP